MIVNYVENINTQSFRLGCILLTHLLKLGVVTPIEKCVSIAMYVFIKNKTDYKPFNWF